MLLSSSPRASGVATCPHADETDYEQSSCSSAGFRSRDEGFFSIIAGIPLKDFTGRRANVDRLLFANKDNYFGVFGKLNAAHGVIEAQSSSSLHTHFHLWGHLNHKVIEQ